MIWIIAFHVLFLLGYAMDPREAWAFFATSRFGPILDGIFGLDVLFVLSGFLIGGAVFRGLRSGRFSLRNFYIRRAARIFPAYLPVLALGLFLAPNDRANVWANLLFVNNYIPYAHQVAQWTWTNAIEGQFYVIFPLAAILVRNRRYYLPSLVLALLALLVISTLIVVKAKITFGFPSPTLDPANLNRLFDLYYDKTPIRIGAIICGLIAAWFYESGMLRSFFARRQGLAFALVSAALLVLIALSSVPWYVASAEARFGTVLSTFYLSVDHTAFAAATAYVLLFALSGTTLSRPVAAFLGWRAWYWPAELSYSAYLLNPIVILMFYWFVLHPAAMTLPKAIGYELLLIPLTYACALPLYLGIERPVRRLARIYTQRRAMAARS